MGIKRLFDGVYMYRDIPVTGIKTQYRYVSISAPGTRTRGRKDYRTHIKNNTGVKHA